MRLIYSPQRADIACAVEPSGELLLVTVNGQSDIFDFTDMPDGSTDSIDSVLSPCPVLRAERVGGELTVHLIHWHGPEPRLALPGLELPQFQAPARVPPEFAEPLPQEGETEAEYGQRYEAAEDAYRDELAAYDLDYQAELAAAQAAHDEQVQQLAAEHTLAVEQGQAQHAEALAAWQLETQVCEVVL